MENSSSCICQRRESANTLYVSSAHDEVPHEGDADKGHSGTDHSCKNPGKLFRCTIQGSQKVVYCAECKECQNKCLQRVKEFDGGREGGGCHWDGQDLSASCWP